MSGHISLKKTNKMSDSKISDQILQETGCRIVTLQVTPVNDLEAGIAGGRYYNIGVAFKERTVQLPVAPTNPKKVDIITPDSNLNGLDYLQLFRQLKKKPCDFAPNYLLGLMVFYQENQLPGEMLGLNIVASGPDNCVFYTKGGLPSFMYVNRIPQGLRKLNIVPIGGFWGTHCSFLAEDE